MGNNKKTARGELGSFKRTFISESEIRSYKEKYFNWSINTDFIYAYNNFSGDFRSEYSLLRDIDEFEFIIRQLNRFRSWTWRQIETSFNGTSCGMMNIDILDEKRMVSEHLESIYRSDVDVLYKMEINNHHRVWGIREGACLFLIWNDPEHKFYKHHNSNYTAKKEKKLK